MPPAMQVTTALEDTGLDDHEEEQDGAANGADDSLPDQKVVAKFLVRGSLAQSAKWQRAMGSRHGRHGLAHGFITQRCACSPTSSMLCRSATLQRAASLAKEAVTYQASAACPGHAEYKGQRPRS